MLHAPWKMWKPSASIADDVDDRDRHALEAVEEVVVRVAAHEVGVGRAPGEVEQVEDDEEGDDDARSSASCATRSWRRRSRASTGTSSGRAFWFIRVSWYAATMWTTNASDQHDAHAPQQDRARERRLAEVAQPLAVDVDVLLARGTP